MPETAGFPASPSQAGVAKFARGTMSFQGGFVDRTRCKNAANCFEADYGGLVSK